MIRSTPNYSLFVLLISIRLLSHHSSLYVVITAYDWLTKVRLGCTQGVCAVQQSFSFPLLAAKGFNSSAGCLIDLLLMGRSAAADAAERVQTAGRIKSSSCVAGCESGWDIFLNVLIALPDQGLSAADRPCQGEPEREMVCRTARVSKGLLLTPTNTAESFCCVNHTHIQNQTHTLTSSTHERAHSSLMIVIGFDISNSLNVKQAP